MPAVIPILPSIADLADTSDAWIVDIWGVMHNGARAHPAAARACSEFRARGGTVVLLSNAPRPFSAVVPHMAALGVPSEAYDAGVTSGDVTRDMLAAWAGRRMLHVGPPRDHALFTGLDVRLASATDAEVVLCSGLYDDERETPADYAELIDALAARTVPMICANPDIMVERGDKLLAMLLSPQRTYPNLFDAHPPFQIDGNFGATAAIAEMLLQSHRGRLKLLPALPRAWATGSIRGLRARGGFEVDLSWADRALTSVTVTSHAGEAATLLYGGQSLAVALKRGRRQQFVWRDGGFKTDRS